MKEEIINQTKLTLTIDTIKRVKRPAVGLKPRIFKELFQINKTNRQSIFKKMGKRFNKMTTKK